MSISLLAEKTKLFAKEHLSFLVIVMGGLSFLLANILLKEVLDEAAYGVYSLVITFVSIVYIYGLLGFEQVFLRYSKYKQANTIITQKSFLSYVYVIVVTIAAVALIFFVWKYFSYYNNLWAIALAMLGTAYSLFLFNVFRLNHEFVKAQLLANSWRIILLILAVFFWLSNYDNVDSLLNLVLLAIVLVTIIAGLITRKKIKFAYTDILPKKETRLSFVHFFISISTLSMLLFGDRLIVEAQLGVVAMGDYFYLCNLVLAPFTLLQSYVGFRQLIQFKDDFSLAKFKKFNKQIILFSLMLSAVIGIVIIAVTKLNVLNFSFWDFRWTIVLLIILGMIRLYSASVLSAFEAKTSIHTLKQTNLWVITVSIVLLVIFSQFFNSLNSIVVGFILLWFGRTMIYRYMLIRQIKEYSTGG